MEKTALLVTVDLMTTSQAIGAAKRAEVELEIAGPDKAAQSAKTSKPFLVAIDLQGPIEELGQLTAELRTAAPEATLIAFGPHVQELMLAAARDAGCDKVITRGQFHREFDSLLAAHAPAG